MRATARELRYLKRMAQMVAVGVALLITGLILNPPRALLRRLHKETQ